MCECLIDIVAAFFAVSSKELRKAGRTAVPVSRVRQIAMYVAHVVLQLTQAEVGRGFGRDRTTVLHACQVIEDMRDDQEFDRVVQVVERIAHAAFRNRLDI
ncbi:chromosomal replication initiator DnaA [Mesorhizobium sp. Root554]|nr:chromosomal replication initiator DnaA [Mesorhizobium sp. Root1471]KQZ38258.1 chromosomal replication initiator DnaA [Mesorhizobium sp. Root554]